MRGAAAMRDGPNPGAAAAGQASDGARPFDPDYYAKWNYAGRWLGAGSMYWFARRYYAALVRRHAPRRGGALLEIGCGLGHLLAQLQDDFRCLGVDVLESCIERTRRNAPRAAARCAGAEALRSFDAGTFSVVVSLHVMEHLAAPADTLNQAARILEPGGLLLFVTPQPDYWLRRFKDPRTDAIGIDPTHINVHPPSQWRVWCERAGFSVVKHYGDGLWDVPYLPYVPAALQFAVFGLPALVQVATRATFTPLSMGVNQIVICRKAHA